MTAIAANANNKDSTPLPTTTTSKVILYNPNVDYSAPLQQHINPDLIGSHPHAQQHVQQQQHVKQISGSGGFKGLNLSTITANNIGSNCCNNYNSKATIKSLAQKLSEQCQISKTIHKSNVNNSTSSSNTNGNIFTKNSWPNIAANTSSSNVTNSNINQINNILNNYKLMDYNTMKSTATLGIMQPQQQQQQPLEQPPQYTLGDNSSPLELIENNKNSYNVVVGNNNNNNNNLSSISNLLTSNNLNTITTNLADQQNANNLWSAPKSMNNIYNNSSRSSNNNNNASTVAFNNMATPMGDANLQQQHTTETVISSLWNSVNSSAASSSGCSSGSGSQPSLSPTMLSSSSLANNYCSNSKESLWSQQASPSAGVLNNGEGHSNSTQLRDTFYTVGNKTAGNTPNSNHNSTTATNIGNQAFNVVSNTTASNKTQVWSSGLGSDSSAPEDFINKISNIWDVPSAADTSHITTQDLFPEIWNNLSSYQHPNVTPVSTTDNISDINSNTSSDLDIWCSPHNATTPLLSNKKNTSLPSSTSGTACLQLFSEEFLFK